jgi:hypothetical protein
VTCTQCNALSKRSRQRCQAPAIKGKTKCRFHGGKSTGARTEAGRARIAKANTTSGKYTREYLRESSEGLARIRACGEILFHTGGVLPGTPRTRGRKPKASAALESLAYLSKLMAEERKEAAIQILRDHITFDTKSA